MTQTTKKHLWGGYTDGTLDWRYTRSGLKAPAIFYTMSEALEMYNDVRKIYFQEGVKVPPIHERM